MTVIVGILNAKGCVLASDSAQSNSINNKITGIVPTTKKIFELENQKVAIGIYGNLNYFNIPLQNIIGTFSRLHSKTVFKTVKESKEAFMNYIASLDVDVQYMIFLNSVAYSNISSQFDEELKKNPNVSEVIDIIYSLLSTNWSDEPATTEYISRYNATLNNICKDIENYFQSKLASYRMTDEQKIVINNWIHMYHKGKYVLDTQKGNNIIFIGFGTEELLPSISITLFSGKYFDDLQTETMYEDTIVGNWAAILQPLADSSEIYSYMNGVHPTLLKELTDAGHLKRERITDEYTIPFLNAIAGVNLQELGELGKSLVTITSLKKRFSNSDESVGGPVQLISIDLINGCKHEIF